MALNEKNMLAKVSSPFVVNLYYAFQTSDKLAFILDLMNGGGLAFIISLSMESFQRERWVRFIEGEGLKWGGCRLYKEVRGGCRSVGKVGWIVKG